ncbi:MAG: hypothetical protein ACM34K_05830 [Bacillota bacterium]
MNRNHQSLLSYIFILVAIAYMLKLIGIISLSFNVLVSYAFLIYGIVSVYVSMGRHQRGGLFLGTAIFLTGVVLLIVENFTIIQPNILIFPSLLFITGAGFLMLFIDESGNKIFLYTALILIPLSILSMLFVRRFTFLGFANRLTANLADYYPVFIILLGVYLLMNRKS